MRIVRRLLVAASFVAALVVGWKFAGRNSAPVSIRSPGPSSFHTVVPRGALEPPTHGVSVRVSHLTVRDDRCRMTYSFAYLGCQGSRQRYRQYERHPLYATRVSPDRERGHVYQATATYQIVIPSVAEGP